MSIIRRKYYVTIYLSLYNIQAEYNKLPCFHTGEGYTKRISMLIDYGDSSINNSHVILTQNSSTWQYSFFLIATIN